MYNGDLVAPVLNPQQISGFQAGKLRCYSSVLSDGLRGQAKSRSLQRKSIHHYRRVRNSSTVPSMSFRVCFGIFICFCSAFSGNVLFFFHSKILHNVSSIVFHSPQDSFPPNIPTSIPTQLYVLCLSTYPSISQNKTPIINCK